MNKNDLTSTLLGIDEEAGLLLNPLAPKPRIIVVGGSAFMLRDLTMRQVTHDIDILHADEVVRGILQNYPQVNGRVAAFADQIPYNFEDRLAPLEIGARSVEFLTPSAEDLIVMKLFAQRPNDVQDIDGAIATGRIDWNLLDALVYGEDETRASRLVERRYEEMLRAYETLKEKWQR